MATNEPNSLLVELIDRLERIADAQERRSEQLERGAAERHHELMQVLTDLLRSIERIEHSQFS